MSIVVPCPLLKFAAKSSFFNYCQLCFDFPVTYFVSFMKYSCFTCFLFLSKYTHLLDRTHELILPMCPFMLHFTTMNNPPAISIFYVFREWSSIWFMCPGFLCNISESPRTVTHIACAKWFKTPAAPQVLVSVPLPDVPSQQSCPTGACSCPLPQEFSAQ